MGALVFIKDYLIWHYIAAFKEGAAIWKNFLWFVFQFFSIGLLLRTLFSPWRRMQEYRGRGFDPQKYFETTIINIMMRFIGFLMRGAFIIIGLVVEVAVIIMGAAAFIIWFAMPFFIILFLSRGIMLFF